MANCEGCFADGGFECRALKSKPSGECRFYKTAAQLETERIKSRERLIRLGKEDLIRIYKEDDL